MKATLLFVGLLLLQFWQTAAAQTPIDTTQGRFYRPIFPNVTVTSGVAYGSAVTAFGAPQTLLMDVYQPTGDVAAERPVIIFAHQGGFFTGSRTDAYMVKVCTQFAKLGYVTASIDYRLGFPVTGFNAPADTPQVARAAIRGMQDMRAAVRFFRKDAATANAYRVSPSRIVVGGSSAGGFMALEVGYLDKDNEVPEYVGLAALGGIEGASGNPGFSSAVLAVLNLSGATERPSLIEPGNAPLYSLHGTADATVPYLQGKVGSLLPPKYVFGSGRLHPYATLVGVPNLLRTLTGAGHVPFESTSAAGLEAAETAFRDIRDFLRPLLVPVTGAVYPSLVIDSPTNVAGGAYQDITINSNQAVLTGNITVHGTLVVKSLPGQVAGSLKTNCFVVDGPGSFELQAGATLRICSPEGISAFDATGAIRTSGPRSFNSDAGYAYEGTTNQVTGSGLPAQVRELEIAVPATSVVSLTNNVSVSQRYLPKSGVLNNVNQNITLMSGPAGTALVTPGPGTLTNVLSVRRYIDSSVNSGLGYRHLAPPVQGITTTTLAMAKFTPVLTPAYNTSARPDLVQPFPNVFGYDQQRVTTSPATSYSSFDKGWLVPAAPVGEGAPLAVGRGYAVNIAAGQTVSFVGELGNNNAAFDVALPAAASPEAGWHLVGNPFASALNWDNVPVPAGMSPAMYIFVSTSQYSGQYRTYLNGIGAPGAATIPLGQGFFVRSLAATPVTLTFPVSARITDFAGANATTLQRSTADSRPRLRLSLADAATPGSIDDTYLYLEAGATTGSDLAYDAEKLPNPSGLNLASVAAGKEMAINGLPLLTSVAMVPLALTAPHAGTYVLAADDLANFAPGTALTLTDALTGTRTPLAAGTQYRFTLAGLSAPNRFALELRSASLTAIAAAALAAQLQVYPNPASGSFRVQLPLPAGVSGVAAWLTNALGQTVRSQSLAAPAGQLLNTEVNVRGLAPGVYQLHLRVAGTPLVRRMVVQ